MARLLRDFIVNAIATTLGEPTTFITEFQFKVETTTLSHIGFPLATVIIFCVCIPLLQHFMRGRFAPPLKYLVLCHNIFLCISSSTLALFLMATLYAFHEEKEYGAERIYCGLNYFDQKGTLTFIYYINYLFKYYELLDTVLLTLKHKPLSFLHCYHHPATLVLTWAQLVDSSGAQWVPILLNLYVHTIMYFYYAMSTLKVRMPWKKLVTIIKSRNLLLIWWLFMELGPFMNCMDDVQDITEVE
eukprot:566705_1